MTLLAARAEAGGACRCRLEVAGVDGAPLAVTRATKTAEGGSCTFDVRLRVTDPERCTATESVVRGVAAARTTAGWGEGWERVVVAARARRHLRARVRGEAGATGRTRLALRCRGQVAIDGCAAVDAESISCFLGGGSQIRVAGLDSGTVCPGDAEHPKPELVSENLAVWNGVAYTCPGSSLTGAFVATPVDGGDSRMVAGPCAAVTTDGTSLYVLPDANFDTPPATGIAALHRKLHSVQPVADATGAPVQSPIRGYDVPEAVPAGSYRIVFDPATLPADSPCAGVAFTHLAAHDGVLYASGCRPSGNGQCTPQAQICVYDTRTGSELPPLTLQDSTGQDFTGAIRGMSSVDGGRLLVMTDDQTSVPPVGYAPQPGSASKQQPSGPPDRVHIFDTATGARLDTRELSTSGATGISCSARTQ
jgi:hypothetical protein